MLMLTKQEILNKTHSLCKCFYNIMPIDNISSVINSGILSFNNVKNASHTSVALTPVQERRENVIIPNGGKLHSYANLYFTYHNPMLYRLQDKAESLCILAIDTDVLEIPGCILSDRNASTFLAKFYSPEDGFDCINFNLVYAKDWRDIDTYEYLKKKAIKCAEILVPNCVPYEYITSACVLNDKSKKRLIDSGFNKEIIVNSSVFYR